MRYKKTKMYGEDFEEIADLESGYGEEVDEASEGKAERQLGTKVDQS